MLVVAPIVILAIGAFLTAIISMTGEVLASRASNNLAYNVQDALNHIDQDVKLSSKFLAINTVLGTDQGINNDATGFTNSGGTTLILNMIATTTNPLSTSSSYVFLKNKPNDCSAPQNNVPFNYNIVYFVKENSLYRRTVMPTNYNDITNTVCNVPWQQPSCSPAYMDTVPTPPSNFCKTKDVLLVEGIGATGFLVQYYNGESTTSINTPAVSATSPSDRNAALQPATTISVSINAAQTAAGRSVERSANLRTSRLDSNASGIATITADSIPFAPFVTPSITDPTTAVFSWPKVTGATNYLFEYQVNGGAWNSNATTAQTFSIPTTTHKDVVNARVTAINAAGSSGYGTASITVPLWTPGVLQNGWVDYSPPYSSAAYTKTSAGLIVLKGMVRAGSAVIYTLPPGYRPAMNIMFQNTTNGISGRVDIKPNGEVSMSAGGNPWFSLDGIAFMPSGTTYTGAAFESGWGNYSPASGDTAWQAAGYMTDSANRVQITGLIRAGTVTSGTVMFRLPVGSRPPEYMHILNDVGNVSSHYSIDGGGAILAKGFPANNYVSLQGMFYSTTRVIGTNCLTQWCALPMLNGWKAYSAPTYSTPGYTKSSDGLVMLRGLLNGGSSAAANVATLPAAYCPAETMLLSTVSADAHARIDIVRNANNTCTIVPNSGVSLTWLSLDNIRYMADQ